MFTYYKLVTVIGSNILIMESFNNSEFIITEIDFFKESISKFTFKLKNIKKRT